MIAAKTAQVVAAASLVMVGRNARRAGRRDVEDAASPTFSHCEIIFSCVMQNATVDARRQGMEQRKLHHIIKKCLELRVDHLVVLANLELPELGGVQKNWWKVQHELRPQPAPSVCWRPRCTQRHFSILRAGPCCFFCRRREASKAEMSFRRAY